VFFTLVLLTTNVVSLGFRERIAEFATLKSLGFRDSAVFNLVLTESLALCIVGAGCGVVLALLIEPVLAPQLEQVMSGVRMTWLHSAQAMSIAVVLGTAVGILPALRARRLPIAQALREAGE
jgi:putative ABC transport system permease protein